MSQHKEQGDNLLIILPKYGRSLGLSDKGRGQNPSAQEVFLAHLRLIS